MRQEYDTIIVGGGVVGNTIAFHLSEKQPGESILVLEQNYPLSGTSGSTQAWVWVHTKTPSWYGEISMFSAEIYPFLQRKIGDIEFNRTGGLALFFTEKEREHAKKLADSQRRVGIEIEVLSQEELFAREPSVSPLALGATYSPIDGNVNPMRLVEMLMRAAKKNGVAYQYYNKVVALKKQRGSFVVTSSKGTFRAKNLVLSAGIWSAEVGRMLGIDIPVRPLRGQVIITEPLEHLLNHTISGLRQTANGEVLVGYSKEEAEFDRSTTLDVIQETASYGISMIPSLAKANVVRTFSGLRVMPKDELPILGKVPRIEGLYVAAMHSGMTLAPLIGTLMAELIVEGEASIPMERFSIARFD